MAFTSIDKIHTIYIYIFNIFIMNMKVSQSCPTLCEPMDYNLPGSSVQGILQAKMPEWVTISFFMGSS